MKARKPPSPLALVAALVIGGLGTGGGYLLGKTALRDPAASDWFARLGDVLTPWDLLAVPLLLLLVLGVHEIGHLLAGLSQGMRFLLLIFGPFQWQATTSGIRFRWVTHAGLMGGLAAAIPRTPGPGLSRQIAVMIAGGPAASLLLAVAAGLLTVAPDVRLAAWAGFVAVTSLGIFLVTIAPMRAAGYLSDGAQLLEVRRGGSAIVERMQLMHVAGQSLAGVRPRDWDSTCVDRLAAVDPAEPTRRIAGWLLLLYRAIDRGEPDRVHHYRSLLARDVDEYPDGLRQSIHVELAIDAALAGKPAEARAHLSSARGGIVEESRRLLAHAALAKLEGEAREAAKQAGLALAALSRATDGGLAQLTRDQIVGLRDDDARSARGEANPS